MRPSDLKYIVSYFLANNKDVLKICWITYLNSNRKLKYFNLFFCLFQMLLTSSSRQLSQETGSSYTPLSSVTVLLPPSWLHTECSAHLSLAPPSHTARPDILVGEKRKKLKYMEARATRARILNVYGAQESIPRNEFHQPMSPGGPVR